jgi:hypothetical protein
MSANFLPQTWPDPRARRGGSVSPSTSTALLTHLESIGTRDLNAIR